MLDWAGQMGRAGALAILLGMLASCEFGCGDDTGLGTSQLRSVAS